MPGLDPGIHTAARPERWREMPGTSPGMTEELALSLSKGGVRT